MANKENEKRYRSTLSMRFPGVGVKIIYAVGLLFGVYAVIGGVTGLAIGNTVLLGTAALGVLMCFLWLFACRSISETAYSKSFVSFNNREMRYITVDSTYRLAWDDCVACGIKKTVFTHWVYISDHELAPEEFKEFPENVKSGVMYFDYDTPTYEEFRKFVPEHFGAELDSLKAEMKIKETVKSKRKV